MLRRMQPEWLMIVPLLVLTGCSESPDRPAIYGEELDYFGEAIESGSPEWDHNAPKQRSTLWPVRVGEDQEALGHQMYREFQRMADADTFVAFTTGGVEPVSVDEMLLTFTRSLSEKEIQKLGIWVLSPATVSPAVAGEIKTRGGQISIRT